MNNDRAQVTPVSGCIRKLLATLLVVSSFLVAAPAAKAGYASLVMDASNGRVLSETNSDLPHFPASLTKMMSLYLLFEALEGGRLTLDQALPVSLHASQQSPTKLGLRAGQWITVENAILGLVTKSANDAAVVIAEGVGGSEPHFASMMTAKARGLGMSQTRFRNASGLPDPEQVTTAHDMALLALALLHDYPQYYRYFSIERFYYGGGMHPNHNRMLGQYPGLDGIKTGYTNAAGYNLVASAEREGRRVIGVVMGARSSANRNSIMTGLLDQAFAGGEIVPTDQTLPARVIPAAYAVPASVASPPGGALASAIAAADLAPSRTAPSRMAAAPREMVARTPPQATSRTTARQTAVDTARTRNSTSSRSVAHRTPPRKTTASRSTTTKKTATNSARASSRPSNGQKQKVATPAGRPSTTAKANAPKSKVATGAGNVRSPAAKPAKSTRVEASRKRGVAESDRRPSS